MTLYLPCIKAVGPANAKIVAVGEAPGSNEEVLGRPLVGASGYEFARMLLQAGLAYSIQTEWTAAIEEARASGHILYFEPGHVIAVPDMYLTNVLSTRPPNNKLFHFQVKKADLPAHYFLPPMELGKYLHPDLLPELDRLYAELTNVKPNLILAMGNVAIWAILGRTRISSMRGYIFESPFGKVLPVFHPAYILRNWAERPILVTDLIKAKNESEFPDIRRPERYVLINPTLRDLQEWEPKLLSAAMLAVDTETRGGTITELGFAVSKTEAIVIPFFTRTRPGGSYWLRREEMEVRRICYRVLSSPVPKVFQNGIYDLQYFIKEGYKVRNIKHDTMILQHALYPGMRKGLGFLGSIYCNDSAWKMLRPKEDDTLKAEDE